MKFRKFLKLLIKTVKENYIIFGLALVLVLVGITTLVKFFAQETTPTYVRLKVSQGLWWANTGRPPLWYLEAIKKGDRQYDLLGKPIAEILEVRYYPYQREDINETQYDIYLTVKLNAGKTKRTNVYDFNRASVVAGGPIELEFTKAQVTGVIMKVSEKPFEEEVVEAEAVLTKRFAFPWEYGAVLVGDKYFDGSENVFEVIDKSTSNSYSLSQDAYGNLSSQTSESLRYITVSAKIKAKKVDGRLIFGEEQEIKPGLRIYVTTSNYEFENYQVSSVRIK